jgi:hypothetical protein
MLVCVCACLFCGARRTHDLSGDDCNTLCDVMRLQMMPRVVTSGSVSCFPLLQPPLVSMSQHHMIDATATTSTKTFLETVHKPWYWQTRLCMA